MRVPGWQHASRATETRRHELMNAALNAPTLFITAIGLIAALVTNRWFTVQICHWPANAGDHLAAFIPLFLGGIIFWGLPALFPHPDQTAFALVVGAAFGIGFSLALARSPSRYSRILGALFLCLYAWLLLAFIFHLVAGGI